MFPSRKALQYAIPKWTRRHVRRKLQCMLEYERKRVKFRLGSASTHHRTQNFTFYLFGNMLDFGNWHHFCVWKRELCVTPNATGRIPARKHFHTLDVWILHLSYSLMCLHVGHQRRFKLWLAPCLRRNTWGHIQVLSGLLTFIFTLAICQYVKCMSVWLLLCICFSLR